MEKKEINKILNFQKLWKTEDVSVEELFLDPENIRLDLENMTQDEIINDLFMNEDALGLVKSIKEVGFFPDEPPVIVKENGKTFVIEGNRRVVALKSMLSPEIAPSNYAKNIKKLVGKAKPIREIEVRLAPSREDASVYLATKHTKTTRRPWTALRRAYFYYAQKQRGVAINKMMERYKGVDIPKYIKYYEMHHIAMSLDGISDDVRKNVSNKRTFKITTLERFYGDEYIRDWMNININSDTGEVSVPKTKSFDKVYSKVITDIVNKKATSREKLKTKESRKIYIDGIFREIMGGKKIPGDNLSRASKFKEKKIKKKATNKKLIKKDLENTLDSDGVDAVLWELKNINYCKFPNATLDMLRTFLEIVLRKYLKKINEFPTQGRNGFVGFETILNKTKSVLNDGGDVDMAQVVKKIIEDKWYMDAINHNPDVFADEENVEKYWKTMSAIIKFIFEKFK